MNARHAARELALLTLFQLDKQGALPAAGKAVKPLTIQEMILPTVRALIDEAKNQIQTAADELAKITNELSEIELEHPNNLNSPIDATVKPVIMTTADLQNKIDRCLQSAEMLFEASQVPELSALAHQKDVQDYANKLIQLICEQQETLDTLINQFSDEWRVDRLVKMDMFILRIAAAEMKFLDDVDVSVSIDEAVELAKDFSTEDSYKFINGVLGALAKSLGFAYEAPAETGSDKPKADSSLIFQPG